MTQEEFIKSIDIEKLRTINLNIYNEENKNHDSIVRHVCVELYINDGMGDCQDLRCLDCPLFTKEYTIKFITDNEIKL